MNTINVFPMIPLIDEKCMNVENLYYLRKLLYTLLLLSHYFCINFVYTIS